MHLFERVVIVWLASAALGFIGCAVETMEPGGPGMDPIGKGDGSGGPLEAALMEVSETGYRCPCHPDVSFRLTVAENVRDDIAIGSELSAVLFTRQGHRQNLVLAYAPWDFTSGVIKVADWESAGEAPWEQLLLQVSGELAGEPIDQLYAFERGGTGDTVVGARLEPGDVAPQQTATVVGLEVERAGRPDFDGKVSVARLSPVLEGESYPGDELAITFAVRDLAGGDLIDWGPAEIVYDEVRERLTSQFEFRQDPGDPDPTGAMLVRVTFVSWNGEPLRQVYEFEMRDGYPAADSVVRAD